MLNDIIVFCTTFCLLSISKYIICFVELCVLCLVYQIKGAPTQKTQPSGMSEVWDWTLFRMFNLRNNHMTSTQNHIAKEVLFALGEKMYCGHKSFLNIC